MSDGPRPASDPPDDVRALRQADLVVLVLLVGLCVVWTALTLRIPQFDEPHTWPGLFPILLLGGLLVMACGTLALVHARHPAFRDLGSLLRRCGQGARSGQGFHRGLLALALLFTYIFVMLPWLARILPPAYSYNISTVVFIFVLITTFRAAPWWLAGGIAALTTAALYVVFGHFYRVPLP